MQLIHRKTWPMVRIYAQMFLGMFIGGAAYAWFLVPYNIAPGGVSGISTVFCYLLSWPHVGLMTFLLNIPLFVLGYRSGGKRFVCRSFVAMMGMSFFTDALPAASIPLQPMLASLFGGLLLGIGLGFVLRAGATTGGTDLAAQMIHNRFTFLSVGTLLFAIDCCVVILAGIVFDIPSALIALVALYISTKVMDTVIKGWNTEQQMMIISDHAEEIAKRILTEADRGATFLSATGAYTGEKRGMIYCVITRAQIMFVKNIVAECDPHAFITVSDAHEVMGEGFKAFSNNNDP